MAQIPPPNRAPLASKNPVALFDAADIRMVDPLYRDEDGNNPSTSFKPPVAMLGGGNGGYGETQTCQIMKGLNTIRLGTAPGWFIPNGAGSFTFAPGALASFRAFAAAGAKLLWLHADIYNGISYVPTGTNAQKVESLTSYVLANALEGFQRLRLFLADNPDMMAATLGLELFNEPAIYNIYKTEMAADPVYGRPGFFEHLFADHCIAIVQQIREWWPGQIQIPLFRYNASAKDLMAKRAGVTALDRIRRAVGVDQLVWSIHMYPGWVLPQSSDRGVIGAMRKVIAPLGKDRLCYTETHVGGTQIADSPPELLQLPYFLEGLQWLRRRGAGVGYFPIHNTGASCPFTFYLDASGQMTHMWVLGEILRLWHARGDLPAVAPVSHPISVIADFRDLAGVARGTVVATSVRIGILGAPGSMAGAAGAFNILLGNRIGGDTLTAAAGTRNHLIVVAGSNVLEARGTMDVLRGGAGTDTLILNGAVALADGGRGPSLIQVNTGRAHIYTGQGKCSMAFQPTGQAHVIRDLKAGDEIDLTAWGALPTLAQVGADVTITLGAQSITCLGKTVAAVQACISASDNENPLTPWSDDQDWNDTASWDDAREWSI